MRSLALLVLLLSLVASAQQVPPNLAPSANPHAQPAPPPGDALPPDILILTGKDHPAQRSYAVPNVYYGTSPYNVPVGVPLLPPSDAATLDATPRFAPLAFGEINRRPFVIVGDTTRVTPLLSPFVFNANPFFFGPGLPFGGVRFGPGRHFRGSVKGSRF